MPSIDAVPKPLQGPWEGETKIVIGIDIGTTQSSVAFAFLQDGANPAIHRVTKWPGQEAQSQQSKIPTLVWYNHKKKAVSFGAEAQLFDTEKQVQANGWFLAKYFKLHLHPNDMKAKFGLKLDDLPPGVSLQQIYSDFLSYLLEHTKSYFEECVLDGAQVWKQYSPTMEVVIAHPNGWGIREQAFLRSAAVAAGLSAANQASGRIRFVTETEASVHFCIHHTDLGSVLQPGVNFAVCDAGGSTVDTTLYSVVSASPTLKLEEKRASSCVQAGSIFVSYELEEYIRTALSNAGLAPKDIRTYIETGVKDFESFTKMAFRGDAADHPITLTSGRFNNPIIRARHGRMKIPGPTIQTFFDTCVDEIKRSVDQQMRGQDVPFILMVGGFSDNEYLQNELRKHCEARGSNMVLSDESSSKAVADGAVTWAIISNVIARAPRYSFGVMKNAEYDPLTHDRQGRKPFLSVDGTRRVLNGWSEIVHKGTIVDSGTVCRKKYGELYLTSTPKLSTFRVTLLAYKGDDEPEWVRDKRGNKPNSFQTVCTIRANLNDIRGALVPEMSPSGTKYWKLRFWVCIRFGGTELESYLEWEENGIKRTGPVSMIFPADDCLNI